MRLKGGGPFSLDRARALAEFRSRLLAWFRSNARDLPWRRARDPYAVWVSEIMLQQTRVAAVIERYTAFLARFPTVGALAAAQEHDVLTVWSGLGYYRRARMMHRAAQVIAEQHDAQLPPTAAELRKLPGIGTYTSAAIASIAFGEAIAVVDGNVERVIMRLMGWSETAPSLGSAFGQTAAPGRKTPLKMPSPKGYRDLRSTARIQQQATRLLDPTRPGDHNQSMMELGATICLPRRPLCLQCPICDYCRTRGEHPTSPRSRMRTEPIAYALVRRNQSQEVDPGEQILDQKHVVQQQVLLEQRPATSTVMASMWELPAIPAVPGLPAAQRLLTVRHAIMQTNYVAAIGTLDESELPVTPAKRQWFRIGQLSELPLTGLARKVLIAANLLSPRT